MRKEIYIAKVRLKVKYKFPKQKTEKKKKYGKYISRIFPRIEYLSFISSLICIDR